VANVEKHTKATIEQIEQADCSIVPTCARSPRLVGQYTKNRRSGARLAPPAAEERPRPVLLRLEALPATPGNVERVRERIRLLNRRLADSGTPLRLRVV